MSKAGCFPGGGGLLPYMGHIGMCRCEGYGFQAEDGIRDPLWSRGLGDVYKRQWLVLTKAYCSVANQMREFCE